MNIEIKKSQKPVKYEDALVFMEKRLSEISKNNINDLIWILEHEEVYTAGTSYSEKEILDKSIKIIKTNRGGKITYHGPGQLICYFVINLRKEKKDIRKFISLIEKTIIETLEFFNIKTFADKENIGIWHNNNNEIKKAYTLRVDGWYNCIIPLTGTPCDGDEKVDDSSLISFINNFSKINVVSSVKLNLMFEEDYAMYGLGLDTPYVDVKTSSKDEFGVNTIYNTSLSIGKINDDKSGYYAVAAETKDVILIEKEWADKILSFITK